MAKNDSKTLVKEKEATLIKLTSEFCDKFINDEYTQLSAKLINKMSRKRTVPYLHGKLEVWAAAVVYALGQINFLFDKSFQPCVNADDMCSHFNTSKSTTSQKAKVIRDMFNLSYWNSEFSTNEIKEKNPFTDIINVNGFFVRKDQL